MQINQLLNRIKQNCLAKKKYFYIDKIKKLQPLINKFVELNIISIRKEQNKRLKIYINYDENNTLFYKNIKVMYTPGRPININIRTLKKIKKFQYNSYYILSTSKGYQTNFEALQNKQGGIIICKFNY